MAVHELVVCGDVCDLVQLLLYGEVPSEAFVRPVTCCGYGFARLVPALLSRERCCSSGCDPLE